MYVCIYIYIISIYFKVYIHMHVHAQSYSLYISTQRTLIYCHFLGGLGEGWGMVDVGPFHLTLAGQVKKALLLVLIGSFTKQMQAGKAGVHNQMAYDYNIIYIHAHTFIYIYIYIHIYIYYTYIYIYMYMYKVKAWKDGVSTQHSRIFSESTSVKREFSQIWSAKNLVVGNSAGYRFKLVNTEPPHTHTQIYVLYIYSYIIYIYVVVYIYIDVNTNKRVISF